jgi:LruC domain-containing protein
MKNIAISILSLTLLLGSCSKDIKQSEQSVVVNPNPKTMEEMVVPKSFNYKTSDDVNFNITLLSNNDQALKGVKVDIMDDSPENGGKIIATGVTNTSGVLNVKYNIPTYLKEVVINTDYIGVVNNVIATVNSGGVSAKIGGKNPQLVRTVEQKNVPKIYNLGKAAAAISYRLGDYSKGIDGGVPEYLDSKDEEETNKFLADINAALPENSKVPISHPEYLASSSEKNLNMTALCDIWVTFIHEGSAYKNGLFYFKYPTKNPPKNVSEIEALIAIFPNASYDGSGGGLETGNKVYIGSIGADTSIGFAIAQDGWDGNLVKSNSKFFYTFSKFNPEIISSEKEHVALLYDDPTEKFVIGFEDEKRENNASDEDFNDCIISVTTDPVESIDKTNVIPTTPSSGNDNDGDGVLNAFDDYPNDANKAYNVFYPSASTYANVAFEDLWPSKGDYDLNDVVVAYQYSGVVNASNKMVSMSGKYKLRAAGGSLKNAFSVELPLNRSDIATITGGLGLEAEATKAIVNVFTNSKAIIDNYNTKAGTIPQLTDTITVGMTFSSPQDLSLSSFNPFIYIDEAGKGRGFEVHLPDMAPTELVNRSILGTNADNSNSAIGRYYKTANNLPFAINIPETFSYPLEREAIINGHLKFAAWAQSGGTQFQDWYRNLSEYRNSSKLY